MNRLVPILRVSEAHFRTLVEELHVGIVLLGSETETLYANRAALEIFGLRAEETLGKSIFQSGLTAIREDGTELPLAECPGPRSITEKRAVRNEVVGWRRAGSEEILWTLVDALPHMIKGQVANVLLSISNITERKRAEEALRVSEELFRTLVENLDVCVVLYGPNAEILFANRTALRLFRRSLESVLGKNSDQLGLFAVREDGSAIPFSMRPVPQVIATEKPVRNEVIGWRLMGTEDMLWTQGAVMPLFTKEGKLNGVVAGFSDITHRKEAEEALHHLSTRLLRLQDEERRRLGRELHDGLAQSVMAVSLNLAQVAKSSVPLGKQARRALSKSRQVLREMSKEIRTLSYLLHPPVLDELGLASAVKEYAQGFSERSGILLELDIQTDFARISEEAETALFRIAQESLSNIQRHSRSSKGKIRLHCNTGCIELEVSDEGCGIAANTPHADANGETGLRLGVGILGMRERMTQLGGTLEVHSSSSGTTIKATIPLNTEASHAPPSHSRGG